MGPLHFIIFGWGKRSKEYDPAYPAECPRCSNETAMYPAKQRRWFSLFFIPILPLWVADRGLYCQICHHGIDLKKPAFREAKELSRVAQDFADGEAIEREFTEQIQVFEAQLEAQLADAGESEAPATVPDT